MHKGKGCGYESVLGCTVEHLLFVNHSRLLLRQTPFLLMFPALPSVVNAALGQLDGRFPAHGTVGIRGFFRPFQPKPLWDFVSLEKMLLVHTKISSEQSCKELHHGLRAEKEILGWKICKIPQNSFYFIKQYFTLLITNWLVVLYKESSIAISVSKSSGKTL